MTSRAEYRRRQAVFGVVGDADRLLDAANADDRGNRAEEFLAVDPHRGRHVIEHRRIHQHAVGMAARQKSGRLSTRRPESARLMRSTASRLTSAPSGVLPWRGSPATNVAAFVADFWANDIGDRFVDDDPFGRHADLALIHEGAEGGGLHRFVEVGVVEHDQRRLAAKFEQRRLQMASRDLGDDAGRRASNR